ncbi:hypothetical protein NECAME_00680 [Necator americanus]|uniref:Aminotransferase class V domain-containing protein n=1 Tax=Necator americanus TaxID=51031 RepID=W2T155_NECAM|nr:hypothetical protein NECAME_00680 [Necator americanus]ETN75269.1 hypothetical protein NECAME_00680 [Necator americanus]
MVLEHFDVTTEEYAVVFTANATHALHLVADCFVFGKKTSSSRNIGSVTNVIGPTFAYLRDSHNSVVGMREIIKEKVNNILCIESHADQLDYPGEQSLFAMTAMSNFCGRKYDLNVIEDLQQQVSRNEPELNDVGQFVWMRLPWCHLHLSYFLKYDLISWLFLSTRCSVFPQGLALFLYDELLLLHNFFLPPSYQEWNRRISDAVDRLMPQTFAGGTVSQILVNELHSVLRKKIEERLEYGTINYYGICALTKGFEDLRRYGGIQAINESTMRIAKVAFEMLKQKTHWNGREAVKIYGWYNIAQQGPIIAFNLLRDDGSYTGYSEVEKMSGLFGIDLRTGCFCNSGACQMYLEMTNQQLRHYFEEGKECGDTRDVIDGRPTGAVRISFGRQSTIEDVLVLEQMIDYCFLGVQPSIDIDHPLKINRYSAVISRLLVYPVKSCRGIELER